MIALRENFYFGNLDDCLFNTWLVLSTDNYPLSKHALIRDHYIELFI